jgi:hypothetical protein
MIEKNPWSRLREDWEVGWVSPSGTDEFEQGLVASTFIVTRSHSLSLLLRANVPEEQMVKELVGLLQAIYAGLLDDLEHYIPPGELVDTDLCD